MLFSWSKKRKQRELEDAAIKRREELQQLQLTLGERAFIALKQAASENAVHTVQHFDAGPLSISKMPQNGGNYSVLGYMSGTNGWYGGRERTMYFALQFNVSTERNRIYAMLSRYGSGDLEGSLDDFEDILNRACTHLRNYRLYQTEAA